MSKVKVKTVGAIIDGRPIGTVLEVPKEFADKYEALGYVEIVKEAPKTESKAKATKDTPKKTTKKSTKDK